MDEWHGGLMFINRLSPHEIPHICVCLKKSVYLTKKIRGERRQL